MDEELKKRELSIIVPVFNEAYVLPGLIGNLAGQRNVDYELIICDGGSTDETATAGEGAAKSHCIPAKILYGAKGRGLQMNRGAKEAQGDFLLFLHADSLFDDEDALRKGIDALRCAARVSADDRVAGRFALRFRRNSEHFPWLYFFHESKARLDRCGCIHGDQGFMLPRAYFFSVGQFGESVPVLEDTRFAESVRCSGKWILFPSAISTSARRFELEGPIRREILNAIIMTLGATGRDDFLREMPHVYSSQGNTGRLLLYPFFSRIRGLLNDLRLRDRISFWYACGRFVAVNSWQPVFMMDVRRSYRRRENPGEVKSTCLDLSCRLSCRVIGHVLETAAGCLLVWIFFHLSLCWFLVTEKASKCDAESGT